VDRLRTLIDAGEAKELECLVAEATRDGEAGKMTRRRREGRIEIPTTSGGPNARALTLHVTVPQGP